jgi:hypothetical protein
MKVPMEDEFEDLDGYLNRLKDDEAPCEKHRWSNGKGCFDVDVYLNEKVLSIWNYASYVHSRVQLLKARSDLPSLDDFTRGKLRRAFEGTDGYGGHAGDVADLFGWKWSDLVENEIFEG